MPIKTRIMPTILTNGKISKIEPMPAKVLSDSKLLILIHL